MPTAKHKKEARSIQSQIGTALPNLVVAFLVGRWGLHSLQTAIKNATLWNITEVIVAAYVVYCLLNSIPGGIRGKFDDD